MSSEEEMIDKEGAPIQKHIEGKEEGAIGEGDIPGSWELFDLRRRSPTPYGHFRVIFYFEGFPYLISPSCVNPTYTYISHGQSNDVNPKHFKPKRLTHLLKFFDM